MSLKKYLRRKKRHKSESKNHPFFQSDSAQHDKAEDNSFFLPVNEKIQAKMKVSQPGDKQEQEADRMADRVVQRKEDEDKMQREASKEEEKTDKKEEEEKVSRKTDEVEKTQRKNDESHNKDEQEDHTIATKINGVASTAASAVKSPNVKNQGGSNLPTSIVKEMSNSFGYDFTKVKVHTDKNAETLNEQLRAQAFTYKGEIYFNKDKFNPATEQGKWLLAHELTHVIQQKSDLTKLQKKDIPGISTPVPKDFTVKKKEEVLIAAEGEVKGIEVIIKPDQSGEVPKGKSAKTRLNLSFTLPAPTIKEGKVTKVNGKAVIKLMIQTTYKEGVSPADPVKFGRGTTAEDKKAGNTSLRFHEGTHGSLGMDYVATHPLPEFTGKVGDTTALFNKAIEKFKKDITAYSASMISDNEKQVECAGNVDPNCAL